MVATAVRADLASWDEGFGLALQGEELLRQLLTPEGVRVRVNKWLNELEQGFYGSALAYDNALTGGQGDLAKVLHRNVFHGEDDASNARAKRLERYVRRELGCLAATDGKAVREASTSMEICLAQETVDALYDRIGRQELSEVKATPIMDEEQKALLEKLTEILNSDERFDVTPSWKQITLHEL